MAIAAILLVGLLGLVLVSTTQAQSSSNNVIVETLAQIPASTGGIAVDSAGNVYVGDIGPPTNRALGTKVYKITPQGVSSIFAEGNLFMAASGNAFDSQGNLLQSNYIGHTINKITPSGEVSVFVRNLSGPVGIAVDAQDNFYVANCNAGNVQRFDANGTSVDIFPSSLFNCPNGIALGDDGNVYVANFNGGGIIKIDLQTRAITQFVNVGTSNNGHIFNGGDGKFYLADRGQNLIYTLSFDGEIEVLAGTGAVGSADGPALQSTFFRPNDVSMSPDGKILYINQVVPTAQGSDNFPSIIRKIILDPSN
jgi:DNA-binding beta-propeller fold protein YncE